MGVFQVVVVMGYCMVGGVYIFVLSDYNIIVQGIGVIFFGGLLFVKVVMGEEVIVEEFGGVDMYISVLGIGDYFVVLELYVFVIVWDIVVCFYCLVKVFVDCVVLELFVYDFVELYGIILKDFWVQFDMCEIIVCFVDGSCFYEYQLCYGQLLVCGFVWFYGYQIGIFVNNGVFFSDSVFKGVYFIQFCDKNRMFLFFFQNIIGFMVGCDYEWCGIIKDGVKLIMVVVGVFVLKFIVVCNGLYGVGIYGMVGCVFDL